MTSFDAGVVYDECDDCYHECLRYREFVTVQFLLKPEQLSWLCFSLLEALHISYIWEREILQRIITSSIVNCFCFCHSNPALFTVHTRSYVVWFIFVHFAWDLTFSGQVWLDDKKSQTVRVETVQVGRYSISNETFLRVRNPGFADWTSQSRDRLSTIVGSRNSCMASGITRYWQHQFDLLSLVSLQMTKIPPIQKLWA